MGQISRQFSARPLTSLSQTRRSRSLQPFPHQTQVLHLFAPTLPNMKNKLFIVGVVSLLTFGSVGLALAAPYFQQTQSMVPVSDTANNNIGTTSPSNLRYNGFFKNLTVSGTCTGCGSSSGTTSTSTVPTVGNLAYWTSAAYPSLLGSVATTTLTASSPLSLDNPVVKVGGSNSILSLSTAGTWSGNAGTATALAANGANCSAGN